MRRRDREVTDMFEILGIVDRAKILRLGLFDGEYPYVIPMHFGYEYTDGRLLFYLHSAREGHKLDLIGANPNVCVELDCDAELVSGGDVACKYGSSFASVIGRGQAQILDDVEEKMKGLALLMKNQTGRDFAFSPEMTTAVAVIKVVVPEFSAKRRPKSR